MAARIFQERTSLFQSPVAGSIGKWDNVIIDSVRRVAVTEFQGLADGRLLFDLTVVGSF